MKGKRIELSKGEIKKNELVKKNIRINKNISEKYNKGITLVALVITIIVLIILAGVSINIVLGEDGIFQKAVQAKEKTEQAQRDEQSMLNSVYNQLSSNKTFEFTGQVQTYQVPITGRYLLEVYGAQGGSVTSPVDGYSENNGNMTYNGGKGGYSRGIVNLQKGQTLYIYVGGEGKGATERGQSLDGGFNGGGSVTGDNQKNHINASGGGATHIATIDGLLSTLEKFKENILIVAGGGGGAKNQPNHAYSKGARWGHGGSGGGTSGGGPIIYQYDLDSDFTSEENEKFSENTSVAGTQESGAAFGKGQDTTGSSAGGGGFYGGKSAGPAGGGSGYIDNLESATTKNGVKSGNGYAKITFYGN